MTFFPSRKAARQKLEAFLPHAGRTYQAERNFDRGPDKHTSVSGLSPYIRHRVLSEEEVVRAVLAGHTLSQADKFIQEVFWRTYWKGWLEHRPEVWEDYLQQLDRDLTQVQGSSESAAYAQAIAGETGIEVFDAWAKELVDTGYLHNHARMWFASIWIFTLDLPWSLGADFFLRHLLDGDPATNTLSWRWVGGLHTRGKTYLARPGNIEKYAGERFFASGPPKGLARLAGRAAPLEESPVASANALSLPPTTAFNSGAGLLLSEEDLLLDTGFEPTAIAAWMPNRMGTQIASETVRAFKLRAGQDALTRAARTWPEAKVNRTPGDVRDIAAWVAACGLRKVYLAYVPQGYLRPQVSALREALADQGCVLEVFVRDYDRIAWPYADRGFFKLKKQIPAILESLGATSREVA